MSETARKDLTIRNYYLRVSIGERVNVLDATALNQPRVHIAEAIRGWAAVVLTAVHHSGFSHISLLRQPGRSSAALASARRLLIWLFMEVSDSNADTSKAWLEQCMGLCRRSIEETLKSEPPESLSDALATCNRLLVGLGVEDMAEVIAAGLLGERKPRSRLWSRGFLERFGL